MTEKYNPWSVVNVVFRHLADEGLHPSLGDSGDPSEPAAALLTALGVTPGEPAQGDGQVAEQVREELAALRSAFAEDTAEVGDDSPASGRTPPG